MVSYLKELFMPVETFQKPETREQLSIFLEACNITNMNQYIPILHELLADGDLLGKNDQDYDVTLSILKKFNTTINNSSNKTVINQAQKIVDKLFIQFLDNWEKNPELILQLIKASIWHPSLTDYLPDNSEPKIRFANERVKNDFIKKVYDFLLNSNDSINKIISFLSLDDKLLLLDRLIIENIKQVSDFEKLKELSSVKSILSSLKTEVKSLNLEDRETFIQNFKNFHIRAMLLDKDFFNILGKDFFNGYFSDYYRWKWNREWKIDFTTQYTLSIACQDHIWSLAEANDVLLLSAIRYRPKYLKSLSKEKHISFFTHPSDSFRQLISTFDLSIRDGGHGRSNSSHLLSLSLSGAFQLNSSSFISHVPDESNIPLSDEGNIDKLLENYSFEKILGRTIIFKNKNGEERLAFKFLKDQESMESLESEPKMLDALKKEKNLPKSEGIFNIDLVNFLKKHVDQNVDKTIFFKLTGYETNLCAFVYRTPNDNYFQYLHDVKSPIDFYNSSTSILRDLLKQLVIYGRVFTVADLFHNNEQTVNLREDAGRYLPLVSLTHRNPFSGEGYYSVAGRLTDWKGAVAYPNYRLAGGLCDVGDVKTLAKDYFNERSSTVKEIYSATYRLHSPEVARKILFANVIAEYLYVFHLVAGLRAVKLTEQLDSVNAFPIWLSASQIIFELCVDTIHELTHMPKDFGRRFLEKVIDVENYAKQMQYWMTKNYIENTKKNKVPDDIYPGANVKIDFNNFRHNTFNDTIGCSINGTTPDMGTVNGIEPVRKIFEMIDATLYASFTLLNVAADNEKSTDNTLGNSPFKKDPYTFIYPQAEALKIKEKNIEISAKNQHAFKRIQRAFRVKKEHIAAKEAKEIIGCNAPSPRQSTSQTPSP